MNIYFDNVLIDQDAYAEITNEYKLFENTFTLGSVASNVFTFRVAKNAVSDHPSEVEIDDGTTTFYLVVDKVETDKNFYTYTLTDKLVDFNFRYDASLIFSSGKTTLQAIFNDMVSKAGLTTSYTLGQENIEVSWYDNTVLARDYLSMIAELEGGYIQIDANGNVTIEQHNKAVATTINVNDISELILYEKKTINGVVYDNGVVKYEQPNNPDREETVYISSDNLFVIKKAQIEYVYNQIVGFEFWSCEVPNAVIDTTIRAGDVIAFDDNGTIYKTIAQYNSSFGGRWVGSYQTIIDSAKQEQTEVKGISDNFKTIKTEIDRTDASLTLVAGDVSENTSKIGQLRLDVNGLASTVSELGGGNLIPNFIGEFGVENWDFETIGLYPSTNLYPATHVYPLGVNGAIMNSVDVTGASSDTGFLLWYAGKALSGYGMVLGGEKYSLYIRYQGDSGTVFKVREYASETPVDKNSHTKETTLGTTTTQGSWTTLSDSIITQASTKSVVIVIEHGANKLLTFTDASFNFGNPKPHSQSITDVSLKADLAYTTAIQTADGFTLISNSVTNLGNRVDNAEATLSIQSGQISQRVQKNQVISEINQSSEVIKINANKIKLEGLVTINDGFKVLLDGSFEANKGTVGRFTLQGDDLVYESNLYYKQYDHSDLMLLSEIITDIVPQTPYYLYVYDLNNDGVLDVLDMIKVDRIARGVDPNPNTKQVKSVIRIGTTNGVIKTSVVAQNGTTGKAFVMQADKLTGDLLRVNGFATNGFSFQGQEVEVVGGFLKVK